ncbi:MAG: hypothetical protein U0836_13635 [Pirellulales bacterium]
MANADPPSFGPGDRVLITDGTFANFDGTVDGFQGRLVLVAVNVFGRPIVVEVPAAQLAPADAWPR